MSYKLSICIPIYNRLQYLSELLDSIIKQVDGNSTVEICISDNASSDNLLELVEKYQEVYPHIVYFRWPENMGPDRNFLQAVKIANGEYCWLMGSDDTIADSGLPKVLDILKEDSSDIYMVNAIICDMQMRPLFKSFFLNQKIKAKKFCLSSSDEFMQYANYATSINAFFSYLSINIFRKKVWDEVGLDESMIGTDYIHVFKLLSFLNNQSCMLHYVPEFIVCSRANNDTVFSFNGDVARRQLIDLVSYEKITNAVFKNNPLKRFCVLNALVKDLDNKKRLKIILRSSDDSLAAFYSVYQGMFGRNYLFSPLIDRFMISFKRITLSNNVYRVMRSIYRNILQLRFKLK